MVKEILFTSGCFLEGMTGQDQEELPERVESSLSSGNMGYTDFALLRNYQALHFTTIKKSE